MLETGGAAEARTAGNLAASYAARCCVRVREELKRDRQLPEPKLEHYFEHYFKVVLAFDRVAASLPPAAADLKFAGAEALIDRYYEGHLPERKHAALEQLAALKAQRPA